MDESDELVATGAVRKRAEKARRNKFIMRKADFVKSLYDRYGDGLAERLALVREHNVTSRGKHGLEGGSTGNPDCGFLYLLVRAFRRRIIFEIGTYVGSSAVAMNMAAGGHGGSVTTCDPEDYGCLPPESGIRFLNMASADALRLLKAEGARIDFVFADWLPCDESIAHFNEMATDDMIFTAHDYLPGDKGEAAVEAMSRRYARAATGTWIFPDPKPVEVAPGLLIQQATAALIPNRLLGEL